MGFIVFWHWNLFAVESIIVLVEFSVSVLMEIFCIAVTFLQ